MTAAERHLRTIAGHAIGPLERSLRKAEARLDHANDALTTARHGVGGRANPQAVRHAETHQRIALDRVMTLRASVAEARKILGQAIAEDKQ